MWEWHSDRQFYKIVPQIVDYSSNLDNKRKKFENQK